MPQQVNGGTQSLTLDTPVTVFNTTTPGSYVVRLGLANLAEGAVADRLRCTLKVKTLSGSTAQIEKEEWFEGAQYCKTVTIGPIMVIHYLDVILEQTDGTGRSVEWSVMKP